MNRRALLDQQDFDLPYLYKMMRNLFPKRNDCAQMEDLSEVLDELKRFSIISRLQLRLFLKRYRRFLLEIDKEPMDIWHQDFYREDLGEREYLDTVKRQYWFCYPALIRVAMEVEFGEEYQNFANERDQI